MLTIPLFHNWPSIPTLRTTTSLNSNIVTFRIETSLFCQSQNIKFISSGRKVAIWKPSTDNWIYTTFSTKRKSFFFRVKTNTSINIKLLNIFFVFMFASFFKSSFGEGCFCVLVFFYVFDFFLRVVTWQRNIC